ncbi:glutamate receptor ionotropic, delta-2 [Bactrocera oleae]|uniref:glutamate receptor ionotropic, delta-2 n=1 Tax=Bactrocera oleae TaxID=104688 RepID=UPI00387EAD9E
MNEHQETANSVIFLRPQAELDEQPWLSGVQCLEAYMKITFTNRARLTRAYNMLISNSYNISSPALEIQHGITKLLNEVISRSNERGRRFYQLRTVFDKEKYVKIKMGNNAVISTDYYIIIVDSVELLRQLMRNFISRMNSWNPGARFLLLYNNPIRRDSEHTVAMELFTLLQKQYYVHQIALLYANSDVGYSFSVMDYYSHANCRTIRVTKIGECTNGLPQPSAAELKRKLRKFEREIEMKNCTFQMCAAISAPFVEKNCNAGIELRIINFMRNRLKFKIKQSCKRDSRGIREENGTWTGLLGKLIDRNCDFILGGFYPDNEVNEDFWTSTCYFSDSYTWFVKLAEPRPAWIALYQIFEDETWWCFLALLLITWLFWYFFVNMLPEPTDHKDFSLAGINAMAVSICVTVEERPECYASRIFFLALTFYGVNVVAIYTSQLISVFTDPGYLHQIDSLNEVIEAAIPFGGPDENQDWFENDEDMWIFERYNDTDLFIPNSVNLRAVKNGKRVLLASRMYVLQDRLADQIFAFPKNVFSTPLQIITKAGFPLIPDFNWLIGAMRDHGIFQKIENDFHYNNTYLNRISRMRPDFKESTIVLTTDHLKGPFSILIIGIIGGIILFICELIYYRLAVTCLNKNTVTKNANKKPKLKRLKRTKKSSINKTGNAWWPLKKTPKKGRKNGTNCQRKFKLNNVRQIGGQTYEVNALRDIRFTPIKRRYVDLRVLY